MKIGIIGMGRMGVRHVAAVRSLGCDDIVVCDRSSEALGKAAGELGIPSERQFKDAVGLLENARPECVIVATTADSHAQLLEASATQGVRFILCEKPLATSLAECDEMIRVCATTGCRAAVNHQMRYRDAYCAAKAVMNSEAIGGLISGVTVAGNIGLTMNGTHYFELFRYLSDRNATSVTAWLSRNEVPNPRGPDFRDASGTVVLQNDKGQRFILSAESEQGEGISVVLAGRYGQVWLNDLTGHMTILARKEEYRSLPATRYASPAEVEEKTYSPADAIKDSTAVLRDLLDGGDAPSLQDGRAAIAVAVAAYVSDESGNRSVRTDSGLPLDRKFPWA